jgi:hypothetical protein
MLQMSSAKKLNVDMDQAVDDSKVMEVDAGHVSGVEGASKASGNSPTIITIEDIDTNPNTLPEPHKVLGRGYTGLPEVECGCRHHHCVFCMERPPKTMAFSCGCSAQSCIFKNWGVASGKFPTWWEIQMNSDSPLPMLLLKQQDRWPSKPGEVVKVKMPFNSRNRDTAAPSFWRCQCKRHLEGHAQPTDSVVTVRRPSNVHTVSRCLLDIPPQVRIQQQQQYRPPPDRPSTSSRSQHDELKDIKNDIKELKKVLKKSGKKKRRRSSSSSSSSSD